MIKHIVMWKLKEKDATLKLNEAMRIKAELEKLNGQIEGLTHLEVGIDFLMSDSSYDVVLYSQLADKAALDYYQNHPLHVKVATEVVKPLVSSRVVVDYEL